MSLCDGDDAGYIDQMKGWISWRLDPYELIVQRSERWFEKKKKPPPREANLGIVAEGGIDLVLVLEVDKGCLHTLVFPCDAGHVTEGTSVDVIDADDVCVLT